MDKNALEGLGKRLERLEHQNRKLRVMAWTASVAVIVLMTVGLAPKAANTEEPVQESVSTKELSIVDEQGNPRIVMGIDPKIGPVVTVLDKKGDPAVSIGVVDKDGSLAVRLSDKNDKGGTTCATIGVDPECTPVISLNSKDEKATATMVVVDNSTPRLNLEDSEGDAKTIEPGKQPSRRLGRISNRRALHLPGALFSSCCPL